MGGLAVIGVRGPRLHAAWATRGAARVPWAGMREGEVWSGWFGWAPGMAWVRLDGWLLLGPGRGRRDGG